MSEVVVAPPVKVKPKLRGVFHWIAFCTTLVASFALLESPRHGAGYIGGVTYAVTVALMFGLSALYHRPMWSREARRVLRRLDHSGIFFLIVGTFTAFWCLAPVDMRSPLQLGIMWAAAIIGAVTMSVWTDMPRGPRAAAYVALGLATAPMVDKLPAIIGWPLTIWTASAAGIYILGAAVYARRWPNPDPKVFGYHEVFHLMVVLAAAIHFGVIVDLHWSTS